MLRDKTIGQEIRLKASNGFLLRSHLPPSVGLFSLIPPTFAISYVSGVFFAHYGRGALLNAPGQVTPLLLFGSTNIQHALLSPSLLLLNLSSAAVRVPFVKLALFS